MLAGTLCTPDDSRGGTRGVETGVWTVTLVSITELTVDFGLLLWSSRTHKSVLGKSPENRIIISGTDENAPSKPLAGWGQSAHGNASSGRPEPTVLREIPSGRETFVVCWTQNTDATSRERHLGRSRSSQQSNSIQFNSIVLSSTVCSVLFSLFLACLAGSWRGMLPFLWLVKVREKQADR